MSLKTDFSFDVFVHRFLLPTRSIAPCASSYTLGTAQAFVEL